MKCDKFKEFLPDMMLDPSHVPATARQHLAECPGCRTEWNELQSTMHLLDEWETPEPSPYFDTRLAARLRHERESSTPGWLQRLRTRLLFDGNLHLRPAMAAAAALLLVLGAGSYEGFSHLDRTPPRVSTVSATVQDLELLDSNAKTLQEMAAFDSTDATLGQSSSGASY